MNLPGQITRYMSLRDPQRESLEVLHEISEGLDYRAARLEAVAAKASEMSRAAKPVGFDTKFPSFCFALATGVGKTRLMGASIYYLWKSKGYRNFFILAPGMTIYDKLRAELAPSHPKYMFNGLSDFPRPEVFDGDSYLRYQPGIRMFGEATVFVFNIGKIFAPRTDKQFKFHRFNEHLGAAFSELLQQMGDLVVLMDESHRYRGAKSLEAISFLKPALGLEYTATPKHKGNIICEFGLAQAIGRYVKTPTVVTRTNLTTSDQAEMEKLKLMDGMARHEAKKGRLAEYCAVNRTDLVKPFVLVSTKDTTHASEVRTLLESDSFCEGRYKGKVIEIHSGKTGAESDENVARLLQVEQPTSDVEVVVHVNMLKEGWDVKNLYTIIPLRASVSEILTEQTIGRGLRLPFGKPTGDPDLDELEIISHDQYAKLIAEAKDSPLFRFKEIPEIELQPVKTVPVQHEFLDMDRVLDRLEQGREILFTADLSDEKLLDSVVDVLVREQAAVYEARRAAVPEEPGRPMRVAAPQVELFVMPQAEKPEGFDKVVAAAELKQKLKRLAERHIDVPHIITDVETERKLAAFDVKVSVGPFELVKQHLESTELQSRETRTGEEVEVLEVDNPRGFLAGRLIDAVEELDVASDKDAALKLADAYLAGVAVPSDKLAKVVHQYREPIVADLKTQVEQHIGDSSKVTHRVRSGFVRFRPYSKTVLAKDGIVDYKTDVPKRDVKRYLFTGYARSYYSQVPFDSTPEKDFSAVLEHDDEVLKWVRPAEGNIPIFWPGHTYTPDFIVETADRKFIIEVKARNELQPRMDTEVKAKASAAVGWCEFATDQTKGQKPWEYRLIPDDIIRPKGVAFMFLLSQAVKVS